MEAALRPVLDIMQTVPPWVYRIPAVIIFSLGQVPAIMATIIYGIPPMLRVTTLAFRQVPKDLMELGQAIGAEPRTILTKIEVPAAMPTLVVGLNQCILLSLAMVVLAGLIGAYHLGRRPRVEANQGEGRYERDSYGTRVVARGVPVRSGPDGPADAGAGVLASRHDSGVKDWARESAPRRVRECAQFLSPAAVDGLSRLP